MPSSSSVARSRCVPSDRSKPDAFNSSEQCQEFRAELQAAEAKDKKFTKRKTVLKKIVANITMGNDSPYAFSTGNLTSLSNKHRCMSSVSFVR